MTQSYSDCIATARTALSTAMALIKDEISGYPTPISGCDAQFNHLLADRARVSDALAELSAPVFVPTPRTPSPDAGVESR